MNSSTQELLDELGIIQKQLDKKRKKKYELLAQTELKVKKLDEERASLRDKRKSLMEMLAR